MTPILLQVLYGVIILGILVLIFIGIEVWRIVRDFRFIIDRFEMLTDIKGWFNFATKIAKWKKRKKKNK